MELHGWLLETHPSLDEGFIFITGGAFTPKARDYLSRVHNLRIEKPFDPLMFRQLVDGHLKGMTKG